MIITRIVWKEFRQQWMFFCVLAVIAVVLQIVALAINGADARLVTPWTGQIVSGIAGGFASLFAVACGATLYATEKENGTIQHLQILPLSSWQLLLGKGITAAMLCLVFVLVACVALVAATLLITPPRFGGGITGTAVMYVVALFGLAALEFFSWGWLLSLLTRRPLVAAVVAILLASLSAQLLVRLFVGPNYEAFAVWPYMQVWPWRLAVVAVLMTVNVSLASRWLETSGRARMRIVRRGRTSQRPSMTAPPTSGAERASQLGPFGRLVWQTLRSSGPLMGVYLAINAALLAMSVISPMYIGLFLMGALLTNALAGVFAFTPDQSRSSFRFLVQQHERPTLLWLARNGAWLLFVAGVQLLAIAILALVVFSFSGGLAPLVFVISASNTSELMQRMLLGSATMLGLLVLLALGFVVSSIVVFAVGQFVSICFRSSIIAGIVGMGLGVLVAAWCALMLLAGVPWWWSVLPIAAAFFAAGWWRTPAWLLERRRARDWVVPVLLIVVPLCLVVLGTIAFRARQIPAVDLNWHPHWDPSAMRQISAANDQFRQAAARYVPLLDELREPDPLGRPVTSRENYWWDPLNEPWRLGQASDEELERFRQYVAANQACLEKLSVAATSAHATFDLIRAQSPILWRGYDFSGQLEAPLLDGNQRAALFRLLYWKIHQGLQAGEVDSTLDWMIVAHRLGQFYHLLWPTTPGPGPAVPGLQPWISLPGHTVQSLERLKQQIEEDLRLSVSLEKPAQAAYLRNRELLLHGLNPSTHERLTYDNRRDRRDWQDDYRAYLALDWMPWERARAMRLLDVWLQRQLFFAETFEPQVTSLTRFPGAYDYDWYVRGPRRIALLKLPAPEDIAIWGVTTIWPSDLGERPPADRRRAQPLENEIYLLSSYLRSNRARLLQIALVQYRLMHGSYPENLRELEADFFPDSTEDGADTFPVDPENGLLFAYYPRGMELPVVESYASYACDIQVEAGVPFLVAGSSVGFREGVFQVYVSGDRWADDVRNLKTREVRALEPTFGQHSAQILPLPLSK